MKERELELKSADAPGHCHFPGRHLAVLESVQKGTHANPKANPLKLIDECAPYERSEPTPDVRQGKVDHH